MKNFYFWPFWSILTWKFKKIFSNKIIAVNFKASCCCSFMQKVRNIPMVDFSQNLKSLILGPFLGPLLPKNLKTKCFSIKPCKSILRLYLHAKYWKSYINKILIELAKLQFGPMPDPFYPTPQKKIFRISCLNCLSQYATLTLCKSSENFNINCSWNLILGPFWPLLVLKPNDKIFPKKIIHTN